MLRWMSEGPAAAQRTLSSSLRSGTGGGPARPLPQLLAEVVAALPRKLPAGLENTQGPHLVCTEAAALLVHLYQLKATSAAAGSHPAAHLCPADWQALASFAQLAPLLLQQASLASAGLGSSDTQLRIGGIAEGALVDLCLLFPRGTAFSTTEEMARWCELVRASWLLLAAASAVPQLPEAQRSNAVVACLECNCSFTMAANGCLPKPPGAACSASTSDRTAASSAARPEWDALLSPLLQLSRRLCRAAHFLPNADPASPVAAALLAGQMPRLIVPTFGLALRLLANLDDFG